VLSLRPTRFASPIDKDRADYIVLEDGRAVGRNLCQQRSAVFPGPLIVNAVTLLTLQKVQVRAIETDNDLASCILYLEHVPESALAQGCIAHQFTQN
jgi:hypothetical protein